MSLINIGYSWIQGQKNNFMHDGRFQTLEEVVNHYTRDFSNHGTNTAGDLVNATTLEFLTQDDKEDIIAFLHPLTDTSYVYKEAWSNSFEE